MRLRRLVALVLPARGVGAAPTPVSPNGAHEDDDFSDCEGDKILWEVEQQGSITLKNKKERKWWSWMQWCRKELQLKNASTNRRHKHERGREATAAWLWLVVQMALLHLGAVLYWWSLEGQPSLEVLHDNLARLVTYLLTSVVSFLAAFLYSSPSSSSNNCSTCGGAGKRKVSPRRAAALWWWIRLAVRLYGAGLIWWMLWQDRGNTLEHHGGFNILAFMAFFLPSLSLSLATRCCWRRLSGRGFVGVWVGIIIVLSVCTTARLHRGRELWAMGLSNSRMELLLSTHPLTGDEQRGCSITPPHYPWEDLLPNGFLNFWAGPKTCRQVASFASLDQSGDLLSVNCDLATRSNLWPWSGAEDDGGYGIGQSRNPLGTIYSLPRMEHATWREKGTSEVHLQRWVLSRVSHFAYPNQGPVSLRTLHSNHSQAEAFLVTCGTTSNLLIRCLRNETLVRQVLDAHHQTDSVRDQSSAEPVRAETEPAKAGTESEGDEEEIPLPRGMNVMIVYLDAVSRRQVHRKLPQTVAVLEALREGRLSQHNVSSVFQFFGYHALGYITKLNMRAMYTGTIAKTSAQRVGAIWDYFGSQGYVTGLSDNECEDKIARLANRDTSWHHQFIPPFCLPQALPVGDPHGNWAGPFALTVRCLYGRQVHEWVIDYFERFWSAYADLPRFGIAALIEGHEATGEVIAQVDTKVASLLANASLIDYNRTIVFVVSDHGHHMGLWWSLRTQSAKLENAMPVLDMIVPNWLLDRHPQVARALSANEQRLTTAFDFHETLRHILMGTDSGGGGDGGGGGPPKGFYGRSLFRPIDPQRTCASAGIPRSMCTCTSDE